MLSLKSFSLLLFHINTWWMIMNKINEEGTYLIVVCEILFKHFTNIYSFNSHNSLQSTCYNDPISQMGNSSTERLHIPKTSEVITEASTHLKVVWFKSLCS